MYDSLAWKTARVFFLLWSDPRTEMINNRKISWRREPRGIETVHSIEELAKRWLSNDLWGPEGQSLGPDAPHLQRGWRHRKWQYSKSKFKKNFLAVKAVKHQNTLLQRLWNYLWAVLHLGFKQERFLCEMGEVKFCMKIREKDTCYLRLFIALWFYEVCIFMSPKVLIL